MDQQQTGEVKQDASAGLASRRLAETLDRIAGRTAADEALARIPSETRNHRAMDRLVELGELLISSIQSDPSSNPVKAPAFDFYQAVTQLIHEHKDLQQRFDKLIGGYVRAMLKGQPASLGAYSPGVDQNFSDVRLMCAYLSLDFDALWNGRTPAWQARQALEEKKREGVITDRLYKVYSDLIRRCAKDE